MYHSFLDYLGGPMIRSARYVIPWFTLVLALSLLNACNRQMTPEQFQKHLQEQLIQAKNGDVIDLPEGKFLLDRTLSLTVNSHPPRQGHGQDRALLCRTERRRIGSPG